MAELFTGESMKKKKKEKRGKRKEKTAFPTPQNWTKWRGKNTLRTARWQSAPD